MPIAITWVLYKTGGSGSNRATVDLRIADADFRAGSRRSEG